MDVIKSYSDDNSCYLTNCELLELMHDYVLGQRYGISCTDIEYRLIAKHYLNLLADDCFIHKIDSKEPAPPLPLFEANFTQYICQRIELAEVTDYSAQFSEFICERTEVLLYDVDAQFTDYVCERKVLIDVEKATFQAYYNDFICERRNLDFVGYNAEYAEFICEAYDYSATYETNYSEYVCEREEVIIPEDTTILAFDVDNTTLEGFSQFRMDFEPISGIYGVEADTAFPLQNQTVAMQEDEYLKYRYAADGAADYLLVTYGDTGIHHVKIKYDANGSANTLQEAKDVCHTLYLYDLKVSGNLDISSFKRLQILDIQQANIPVLTLPTSFNEHIGLNTFNLFKVSSLSSLDLSNIELPNVDSYRQVGIGVCSHLQSLVLFTGIASYNIYENTALQSITFDGTAEFSSDYFLLTRNEALTTLVNFNGSTMPIRLFRMEGNTSLVYDDFVNKFPNLTNISGLSAINPAVFSFMDNQYDTDTVNKILVDLDKNSTTGYNYRKILLTGNAAPTSNILNDGIAAKANLIKKGFNVQTA